MDRGTDALQSHLSDCAKMEVHQTIRALSCLELCRREAPTEFKYFNHSGAQIAHSLDDSNCCCHLCCTPIHPFTIQVKELNTDAEMLTVERPCASAVGSCKCCCFQQAAVTSGNQPMGSIKEDCYWCVPQFTLSDGKGNAIYKLHHPTCCFGCCVNCFTEGNPSCGRDCCRAFRVYPADQAETGGDAPYVGKILKKPKSMTTEAITDVNAFEVTFPEGATTDKKALLVGTSIFLDAVFFKEPPPNPAATAMKCVSSVYLELCKASVGL